MTTLTTLITYLRGLEAEYHHPVEYYLTGKEDFRLYLNPLIGKQLTFTYKQEIRCNHCGRKISKTFNNGYCYPCFKELPQNDLCYVKPSLCHYETGTCRDSAFGESYCNQPHVVYLAYSSHTKVGITSAAAPIHRWINQGANTGMVIARTPNRHIAGLLELALAEHVPDKTNWRKMLTTDQCLEDLSHTWTKLQPIIPSQFQDYLITTELSSMSIHYPVHQYPSKVVSLDLVKQNTLSGYLQGIKGQYLILDSGVLNVKKFTGHLVEIQVTD